MAEAVGTAAFTVSVTVNDNVLFVAAGALILMVPVYTLGARPVGSTVTETVLSNPIREMLPLGVSFSQGAPVTLSAADNGAPLLDRTKLLARDALGIGVPVV